MIESLILSYTDVFPSGDLRNVKEVSIDLAIEKLKKNSPSKWKSSSSLMTSNFPSTKYQDDRSSKLKRSKSELTGIENKKMSIKNGLSQKLDMSMDFLDESDYVSLCERHRQELESYEQRNSGRKNGETFNKIKRKLFRIVSFRNGHYQVQSGIRDFQNGRVV